MIPDFRRGHKPRPHLQLSRRRARCYDPLKLMLERFRQRSYELEHLDKGDYTAEEYEGCIVELQRVNRWLGDASALKHSLLAEISRQDLQSFSVVDVGAGS